MQQFKCYGDRQNKGFCVYCGGPDETDDHVPSKVLLDEPYPEHLIVCSSYPSCNNAFPIDETYLACLLECVFSGDADPAKLHRPKIAKVWANNTSLLERLRKVRSEGDSGPVWAGENERVKAVVLNLRAATPPMNTTYRSWRSPNGLVSSRCRAWRSASASGIGRRRWDRSSCLA